MSMVGGEPVRSTHVGLWSFAAPWCYKTRPAIEHFPSLCSSSVSTSIHQPGARQEERSYRESMARRVPTTHLPPGDGQCTLQKARTAARHVTNQNRGQGTSAPWTVHSAADSGRRSADGTPRSMESPKKLPVSSSVKYSTPVLAATAPAIRSCSSMEPGGKR